MFKKLIQKKLERYIVKYFKKHPEVKLVVVAGSIGKTSTKRAIATLLAQFLDIGQLIDGIIGIVFLLEHVGEDFLCLVKVVEVDEGIAATAPQEVDEVMMIWGTE